MSKNSNQPNNHKEAGYIKPRILEEEMQESYLDYAMSVIVSRALPDVRDGLKPVHRRVLYAMHDMGLRHNAKFVKSARVVGNTMAYFHPHGDMAIYDSLVRLAQDFAMRYPLVDGQGNFGCFTGETKVALTDGRNLSLKELVKEHKAGKKNYTYTFNHKKNSIEVAEIRNPRLTRKNARLVEVTLDNREKIKCTADHRFMLRDGSYKEAQFLNKGESLMPAYFRLSTLSDDKNAVGYKMVWQPIKNLWDWAHRLSDQWNIKTGAYGVQAGKVRHHIDFNKLNNNPENIRRMQWADHWRLHYQLTAQRHKTDPEYVAKLKTGRDKFWARPEARQRNALLLSERSKKWWQDPKYRAQRIRAVKKIWQDPDYKEMMRLVSSQGLKNRWQTASFRKLLSETKSKELRARWQNPEYRKKMTRLMRDYSRKLWSNPEHRSYISRLNKKKWRDPILREKQSQFSKQLWQSEEFKNKFPPSHFKKMAALLWSDPKIRELHSEKAKKQWQNPSFRQKALASAKLGREKFLKEHPQHMRKITELAKVALRKSWQDPSHKERVIKSKILGFVNKLAGGGQEITPEIYEQRRTNNGTPNLQGALKYFSSFEEMLEQARTYNHRVASVRFLDKREDVYDLTIDGTQNFALATGIFVHNSLDGDPAAAMRYTETRLAPIAEELLADLPKNTVAWRDNYDATRQEPTVLPAKLPNLLLNGTLGIAVGMATEIPPHNLREIVSAAEALIAEPRLTSQDLTQYVKGPDFPTGGLIYDWEAVKSAYATGKGSIVMRAKTEIVENQKGEYRILITQIPYRVNKAALLEKFATLVRDKKIEGIRDLRDESDKEGVRIVVELKREALPNKVLNQLFNYTQLQETFHLNMLALVDGIEPRVLNLKMLLEQYLKHRREVVERRTRFDLERTLERLHILEGLKIALDQIDAVIKTIKQSETKEEAHTALQKKFKFSDKQATAILEMRLQALAGLERKRVLEEIKEKRALSAELASLLKSAKKIDSLIKKELSELASQYGDERKTQLVLNPVGEFKVEDLIPNQEVMIVITKSGYVKRLSPDTYRKQGRGGKGVIGITTKEQDVVEHLLVAQTHDDIMFFTNKGRVFQTKVYELPEASRTARGQALVNFLELPGQEQATAVLTFGTPGSRAEASLPGRPERSRYKYLLMGTKNGVVKKTAIQEFAKVRRSGLNAIKLKVRDELKWVRLTTGGDEAMMTTAGGQAIRFKEKDVRAMGRAASGVRGIRIRGKDEVMSLEVIEKGQEQKNLLVLVISEHGLGKKTLLSEYKLQHRGGSGIKTMNITKKTGQIKVMQITSRAEEQDLVVISRGGQTLRTALGQISTLGRATQGVRVIKLEPGDTVASATII